jgi:hypothetical protein
LKKVVKISKAESRGIRPYVLWFRFETEATLGGAVFLSWQMPWSRLEGHPNAEIGVSCRTMMLFRS